MGRSQWASRISKRRCSSFLYVAWSGIHLLDEGLLVETVVSRGGVLEDDGDAVVPASVFGGVIARCHRGHS